MEINIKKLQHFINFFNPHFYLQSKQLNKSIYVRKKKYSEQKAIYIKLKKSRYKFYQKLQITLEKIISK